MKQKVAVDYKGKHFIIHDKDKVDDDFDYVIPYIDLDKVNLEEYVHNCIYYGIPFYVGDDKEFTHKIAEIAKVVIKEVEKELTNKNI